MRTTKFLYFDLGNVLLGFDHRRGAAQMAAVARISPEQVWEVVFEGDLQEQVECGQISSDEFYQLFCDRTNTRPDQAELALAGSDIFDINSYIVPLVGSLHMSNHRMGVLSNTCGDHWNLVTDGRFTIVNRMFDIFTLSHEVGAAKPDPLIYAAAADRAECLPTEIFFVDDLEPNVAAAKEAGFDAVLFESVDRLASDLRQRGLEFNF